MTLLRDLIEIPESVGDADFVVRASEGADLRHYVVTDQLKGNFAEALEMAGHALRPGRRSWRGTSTRSPHSTRRRRRQPCTVRTRCWPTRRGCASGWATIGSSPP